MERKYLESWLRDAYAMERAAIEILDKQNKRLAEFPMVQSRIREHLEQTRWHAQQVETCLRSLGTEPTGISDTMARVSGIMAGSAHAVAEDQVIKDLIANSAFENMEITSYRALSTAAQECGEYRIRMACEDILQQEIMMAKWCEGTIVAVTQEFLSAHAVAK